MSGRIVHLEPDEHAAAQMLLPWYLTGRLEAREREQVDAHLATCPDCRGELDTERQWQLMQPGHSAQVDVEHGWAQMRARLAGAAGAPYPGGHDDAGDEPPPRRGRHGATAPWHLGGGRLQRAWAAPALLSVVLVAAIGWTLRPLPAPAVVAGTAADFHALAAPATESATAVVRFRPDATEAQIRHGLDASGARLIDGPTVTDAYVVRLPREHYATALETLRRQPGVALVEALETATPP